MSFKIYNDTEFNLRAIEARLETQDSREYTLYRAKEGDYFLSQYELTEDGEIAKPYGEKVVIDTNVFTISWPTNESFDLAKTPRRGDVNKMKLYRAADTNNIESDMTFTFCGQEETISLKGSITSYKIYICDIDGDGDEDLFLEGGNDTEHYYIENQFGEESVNYLAEL